MADLGFWGMFGAVGTLASIFSLFISNNTKWAKWIHAGYTLLIVAIVLGVVEYQQSVKASLSELSEIKRVERQATALSDPWDTSTRGMKLGYSMSVLAFLEKNRELYPETYQRAKTICDNLGCYSEDQSLTQFSKIGDAATALRELVRGISSLEGRGSSVGRE